MKLWEGRFHKELAAKANDFNSSISFDCRMYKEDIAGSVAHAVMLGECGIIGAKDATTITDGLKGILADIESGKLKFDTEAEDIHSFIEAELTKRIGDAGKKLHTARSRNDQVALDLRMYCMNAIGEIQSLLKNLLNGICGKAEKHTATIMPGYTHLQRAQPVSFAHTLLAYAQMFTRDLSRLDDCSARTSVLPLGAGALAGTTYPINRRRTAELLGFKAVSANSMDSVSDRDFAVELIYCISMIMMHLSRFCEDVILWCSQEFAFLELSDEYSTGSSIMPQKKNPDIAELVRGKTGRIYGDLIALLTVMKGLPLAYNKDMQEDKPALFDAIDTVCVCLSVFTEMLVTAKVKEKNMLAAMSSGFLNATDCADYLTKKGLPFRDAYRITGGLVALCTEKNCNLEQLPLKDYKALSALFAEDIYEAIKPLNCLNGRNVYGGPSADAVKQQLADLKKLLK